jgi:hypothetical protein
MPPAESWLRSLRLHGESARKLSRDHVPIKAETLLFLAYGVLVGQASFYGLIGKFSAALFVFGGVLLGLVFMSLFVFRRPLYDYVNWYLLYYALYFFLGFSRILAHPETYATFAAYRPPFDLDMFNVSVLISTTYVIVFVAAYLVSSVRLELRASESRSSPVVLVTYFLLMAVKQYLAVAGYYRVSGRIASNVAMSLVSQFMNLTPLLSAYLFFQSKSSMRFVYPLLECIAFAYMGSKGALLNVAVLYLMFVVVRRGYSIRHLPAFRALLKVGLIFGVLIYVTSSVVYPIMLSYRVTKNMAASVEAAFSSPPEGFGSAVLDRITAGGNVTLLVQAVLQYGCRTISYWETINIFNYLVPRWLFPGKPAHTIGNLYTSEIAGYTGDYSFAVMVTDVGEAFYHFGFAGIVFWPALLGLLTGLMSRFIARFQPRIRMLQYMLFVSTMANPAEMYVEYKVYSFAIGSAILSLIVFLARLLAPRRAQ